MGLPVSCLPFHHLYTCHCTVDGLWGDTWAKGLGEVSRLVPDWMGGAWSQLLLLGSWHAGHEKWRSVKQKRGPEQGRQSAGGAEVRVLSSGRLSSLVGGSPRWTAEGASGCH